jgi:hypothetical protein
MASDYRQYQREVERRRFGREEEHRHYRIYGSGDEKKAIVLQEHDGGEVVGEHVFNNPEDALKHIAEVIDEHFLEKGE